jgi:DHA2 family multidrug resistance protein-like MFS transporter
MVSSAPLHRSGAAGGMLATARLLGQTAGAASVGVFFHLAGTHATTVALVVAAGVAAAAAGVSLLRLRIAPAAPAEVGEARAGP